MATELIALDNLLAQWGNGPLSQFQPCAHYYEAMDVVLYLQEDVSYRADRVDGFLTLLWHPQEDRAIGVKLKGWGYLFQRLQSILKATGVDLPDSQFVPLISAIEVAVTAGLGEQLVAGNERQRIAKYETAKQIVVGVNFDSRETAFAA